MVYKKRLVQPGDLYGLWTVEDYAEPKTVGGTSRSICRCICGERRSVRNELLLSGNSNSCGCINNGRAAQPTQLQKKIETLAEKHWYGIDVDEDELWNPLNIPEFIKEDPQMYILSMLANPDYFAFVCKELLNIDLMPFQSLLLKEMWERKFPMLIASRGAGKCTRDSWVVKEDGFIKIDNLFNADSQPLTRHYVDYSLLGENGFKKVEYIWKNQPEETRKIKTTQGYPLIGTLNHPIRVVSDGEIVWKNCEDVKVGDYAVIDRSREWFPKTNDIDEDTAYLFGCLVGDGGYTKRGSIGFTTADDEFLEKLNPICKKLWGKTFSKSKSKYQWMMYGNFIWDELFQKYGFNSSVCSEKDFPKCILGASREAVAAFIRGLMDTDGSVNSKRNTVEFASKSKNLVYTLQFILTRFGIISKVKKRLNKKYNRYYYYLYISGNEAKLFAREIGFGLFRKQALLIRYRDLPCNTNIDIVPHDLVLSRMLSLRVLALSNKDCMIVPDNFWHNFSEYRLKKYQMGYDKFNAFLDVLRPLLHDNVDWQFLNDIREKHYFYDKVKSIDTGFSETYDVYIPDDHSFISNGFISHNSWILGLYALLRMIFMPGRKVVITGAAFRQSKVIFEYMEAIWRGAPLLRDICMDGDGPFHNQDLWRFEMCTGRTLALPIGCLSGDTLLTTNSGFSHLESLQKNNPQQIYGNSKFRDVGFFYDNGIYETKKVATKLGFSYIGTPNHKMKIWQAGQIIWCRTDEIKVGDKVLIDATERWHNGDLELSNRELEDIVDNLKDELPNQLKICTKDAFTRFLEEFWDRGFWNKSYRLMSQIQYILLHYGIVSRLYLDDDIWRVKEIENVNDHYLDEVISADDYISIPTYDINIPDENEYCANGFYSHNTGDKIRGQRAHDIISDEFSCLDVNSLVQTSYGLIRIGDYLDGRVKSLLNMDGDFEIPTHIFQTPEEVDVYKITTNYGYSFECSKIHKVMTQDGWKLAKDLTTDDRLPLDFNDYFPTEEIKTDGLVLDDAIGWLLGLLVSEGCVTHRNYITIKNTDKQLIDSIKNRCKFNWSEYYREAYENNRGWKCKESWDLQYSNTEFRTQLKGLGLDYVISLDKTIPKGILQSPRSVVLAFLSGMYEGDGSAFISHNKGKDDFQVVLYSSSRELLKQTQTLLLKFGVISALVQSNRSKISTNDSYILRTRGEMAKKLYHLLDVIKWDLDIDQPIAKRKPSIRKNGERYVVSTYNGNKNHHIGTFDTEDECQAAFDEYWKRTRELVKVKEIKKLDEKKVLYDFYLPKTHSFIANGFIQHNSISLEVFENVISGFGAVSASPVQNVKKRMRDILLALASITRTEDEGGYKPNQIILSGTAYFEFNHFYEYWKKWRGIVYSKGDEGRLMNIFNGPVPEEFDWRDYSVIRLPYTLLPLGFLDEKQVSRSRATIHSGHFQVEYCAVFSKDSAGFFKRSLIEACVATEQNVRRWGDTREAFDPTLFGDKNKQYIIGIDPASEVDNFSIVVLEINKDHRRIVHVWTTNKQKHRKQLEAEYTTEKNYFAYCTRKIRDLMKAFPTTAIALDSQGGGHQIVECFRDDDKLKEGENLILPIIDPDDPQDTDLMDGLHVIHLINFASAEWTSTSNHGLRKDMEDKMLLFPNFDSLSFGLAQERDNLEELDNDNFESVTNEIEELKHELSIITLSQTTTGRDKFDVPEIKLPGGKKDRVRKDRYSALLMANAVARDIYLGPAPIAYQPVGGFAGRTQETNGQYYIGFDEYSRIAEEAYSAYDDLY
jgi:intein/homing endonuclease